MPSPPLGKVITIFVHIFIITRDEAPFQEDRFILHSGGGGGGALGITIIASHHFLAIFLGAAHQSLQKGDFPLLFKFCIQYFTFISSESEVHTWKRQIKGLSERIMWPAQDK